MKKYPKILFLIFTPFVTAIMILFLKGLFFVGGILLPTPFVIIFWLVMTLFGVVYISIIYEE